MRDMRGAVLIAIVDYGVGNVKSIANMLARIGVESQLVSHPEGLSSATKIILPGIGAFDAGMSALHERGLADALNERAAIAKVPVLGICLGMQLLAESSEEGELAGLGWIPGRSQRFAPPESTASLKVPHMGWNVVSPKRESPLFDGVPLPRRFYFVHSYHVVCAQDEDVLATTTYGIEFVSAVARDNVYGVQFHPEKSHKFGMAVLKAFAEMS
jgi:imidazole glycerol-phosphate synthase subunit HisH